MAVSRRGAAAFATAVALLAAGCTSLSQSRTQPNDKPDLTRADDILDLLAERVSIKIPEGATFSEIVQTFRKATKAKIVFDPRLTPEVMRRMWPARLRRGIELKDVPLSSALDLVLRLFYPGYYTVREGVIWVFEGDEEYFETRVYSVGDLVAGCRSGTASGSGARAQVGGARREMTGHHLEDTGAQLSATEELARLIAEVIDFRLSNDHKGPPNIMVFGDDALVVTESWRHHMRIADLLERLRALQAEQARPGRPRRVYRTWEHYHGAVLTPAVEELRRGLAKPVSFNLVGVHYDEALDAFRERTGLNVFAVLSPRGQRVQEGKRSGETKVDLKVENVPAERALDLLVKRSVGWTAKDNVIFIGPTVWYEWQRAEVYGIRDLVTPGRDADGTPESARCTRELIAVIDKVVKPLLDPDEIHSAPPHSGDFAAFRGQVLGVASGDHEVFGQVWDILNTMCQAMYCADEEGAPRQRVWSLESRNQADWWRTHRRLANPVTLDFSGTALNEVVIALIKQTGLRIDVDGRSLQRKGIDLSKPITFQARDVPLGAGLKLMLEQIGLTYAVEDGGIVIADADIEWRIYYVGDVIGPVSEGATPDYGHDTGAEVESARDETGGKAEAEFRHEWGYEEPYRNDGGWCEVDGPLAPLIGLIRHVVAPRTWASPEMPAHAARDPVMLPVADRLLVIWQRPAVHDDIERLFNQLRVHLSSRHAARARGKAPHKAPAKP